MAKNKAGSPRRRTSIRTRVLAIAFVPCFVLLLAGASVAGYLIYDAVESKNFVTKIHDGVDPAGQFWGAVRQERRLTLQNIASGGAVSEELDQVRAATNQAAEGVSAMLGDLADDVPPEVEEAIGWTFEQTAQLPSVRQRVDEGQLSLRDAYSYYNQLIDNFTTGLNRVARAAPDANTAYLRVMAMPLFISADGMARGDALAAAGVAGGGLTEQEFRTYVNQIGAYRGQLETAVPEMIPSVRQQYEQLVASPAWEQLSAVENAFLRGNQSALPVSDAEWREAATTVSRALTGLYVEQSSNATDIAVADADDQLTQAIVASVAILVVNVLVFLVAWRLANRLVRRLTTLRQDTLVMAQEKMPQLVERVRHGESVDLESEVAFLHHGSDEIGQVADAFNLAQQTAIGAAVEEAKTREGTKRVFLNIAHRSQTIVHKQLQALDSAERKQEDPDQLDMLFRLDHLSTRARRNAENLIILGGQQPGRQWRKPVTINDLVRGATAETEDYKRVNIGKMPAATVAGPVVGDLVHLLAELIDNATSFSPPQARVEIRADIVGRGVVLEVEDQGLGIEPEHLDELNATLADPPDFSFMALSDEPRLGLFVVARLAAKHGIRVTLRESVYGGTRAIVLVYTDLLGPAPEADDELPEASELAPAIPQPLRRHASVSSEAGGRHDVPNGSANVDMFAPNGNGTPQPPQPSQPPQRAQQPQSPQQPQPSPQSPQPASRFDDSEPTRSMNPAAPPPLPRRERQQPDGGQVRNGFPNQDTRAHEAGAGQARPPQSGPPASQGGSGGPQATPPPLPRRRRQQNLAPQLHDSAPADEQWDATGANPDRARSRLSAFQQGTRRARDESSPNHPSGD